MLPMVFGENLFDEFFDEPFGMLSAYKGRDPLYGKHGRNLMKTDVRELDKAFEIDMDMPGFKKDELHVDVKDGYLTVSAAKGLDKDEKKEGKYIRRERYAGQCSRSFFVGEDIEPGDVGARFEDGILRITLPKKEPQKKLPAGTAVTIA